MKKKSEFIVYFIVYCLFGSPLAAMKMVATLPGVRLIQVKNMTTII